jgi:hypothetical protein
MPEQEPLFEEDNGAYRVRAWFLTPQFRWRVDVNLSGLAGVQTKTIPAYRAPTAGIDIEDMKYIRDTARAMFQAMVNAR